MTCSAAAWQSWLSGTKSSAASSASSIVSTVVPSPSSPRSRSATASATVVVREAAFGFPTTTTTRLFARLALIGAFRLLDPTRSGDQGRLDGLREWATLRLRTEEGRDQHAQPVGATT